jgi:uroporphyrinogen III methyltransferase / synthase
MSLANKRIVVTRPREQSDGLVAEIEARGGTAVVVPLIAIADPVSWEACDRAIAALDTFDALVFTSTNGVNKFFGRCTEKGIAQRRLSRLPTYAVGEQTRRAIESHGAHIIYTPDDFSSEALGKYFSLQSLDGKKFLMVRGDIGKREIDGILCDRGVAVNEVIVYRTITEGEAGSLGERLAAGEIDALTFASPSAVRGFRQLFPAFSKTERHVTIAVIGPTTHHAAREADLAPDVVAPQATATSLVEALDDYFSHNA